MDDRPVFQYTCTACGLVTRVQQGQNHKACACEAEYEIVNESLEVDE